MKKLLFVCIFFLFLNSVHSQETSPDFDPFYAQKLRLKLKSLGEQYEFKGVSAAVHVPGQGTWVGTYGIANTIDDVTPDMRFGIASNSKAVVAALMLKLQEEGLLDLDDPLKDYLPSYEYVDPNITIRQLLTHTSGLFDFLNDWTSATANAYGNNPDSLWSFEDLMRTVGPPHEQPGKRYRYSNTNFLLAGMIAEAVTNLPIGEVLQTRIFDPLDLDMIYPVSTDVFSSPYSNVFSGSTPILEPGQEDTFLSFTATAGAVWSTAFDMVRWYDALFGKEWLSAESQDELRDNDGYNPYGLGIRLANRYGTSYYYHGGVWGFRSYMIHDTETGISFSFLSNKFGFSVTAAARSLFEVAINERPAKEHDLVTEEVGPQGSVCDFQNAFQIGIKNVGSTDIGQLKLFGTLDQNDIDSLDINLFAPLEPGHSAVVDFPFEMEAMDGPKQTFIVDVQHENPDGYPRDNTYHTIFRVDDGIGLELPYQEEFESENGIPENIMTYNHQNVLDWKITQFAGEHSARSFVRNNYSDGNSGTRYAFDLPLLDIQTSNAFLKFTYAYSSYSGAEEDALRIFTSTDCGETFNLFADLSGPGYQTASPTTAFFLPSASDWEEMVFSLSEFENENLIIRFEVENDFGNHVYIDNILVDISTPNEIVDQSTFKVWPNPANDIIYIDFGDLKNLETVSLYNSLGLRKGFFSMIPGQRYLMVERGQLPAGWYTLQAVAHDQSKFVSKILLSDF